MNGRSQRGDPLFSEGVNLTVVLIVIGKTIAVFALLLISVLLYIWFLRKVIAQMQNRIGPDRAGPFGLLQTLADGIKLFFKEQSWPTTADRRIFFLAPYLALLPAFLAFASCRSAASSRSPATRPTCSSPTSRSGSCGCSHVGDRALRRDARGLVVGVEVPAPRLGARVGAAAQLRGRVRARDRRRARPGQHALDPWHRERSRVGTASQSIFNGDWYWLPAIVALVIFVIAAIAETNHPPFDMVEAEQELTAGFMTEYTGIRFAIFYLAEFMNVITMCAIAVTLFFGGPNGPALGFLDAERLVQRVGDAHLLVHAEGASSCCSARCGCARRSHGCATTSSWDSGGSS